MSWMVVSANLVNKTKESQQQFPSTMTKIAAKKLFANQAFPKLRDAIFVPRPKQMSTIMMTNMFGGVFG